MKKFSILFGFLVATVVFTSPMGKAEAKGKKAQTTSETTLISASTNVEIKKFLPMTLQVNGKLFLIKDIQVKENTNQEVGNFIDGEKLVVLIPQNLTTDQQRVLIYNQMQSVMILSLKVTNI